MDALLEQVRLAATSADEAGRKVILDTLRNVAYSIESSEDTRQRILFYGLKISSVRIGCDLNLFSLLSSSNDAMSVNQLASKTGADPVLLGRILRYLASINMIKETEKDYFAATNITRVLSDPGMQAGVHHYFDTAGPQYQALPDFLAETKYQNVTDNTNTTLQRAFPDAGPVSGFVWMLSHPVQFGYFNQWMASQRIGMPTWLDVYPLEKETKDLDYDANPVVFVDVGGGLGHQCNALKAKYPNLKGRIILQDLPAALEHAIAQPGIEVMAHDFFKPEPIKGAKYYYMRNILHDYPDEKCLEILHHLKDAVSGYPESVILIDDMVLPDSKVHWHATQLDLTMMCALGSMERTREQWYALLDSAGLKIDRVLQYTASLQDSIIVAVPAV